MHPNAPPFDLRPLCAADAPAFRDLRLQAMKESPSAFSADHAENAQRPLAHFAAQIGNQPDRFILGAFQDGALLGMAGFYRCDGVKQHHKAHIWTMYVAPASRGLGLGRRILQDVLHRARALGDLDQVLIAVTVGNAAAARLYANCGFVAYGRERRALKIDGVAYDIDHMVLRL